MSVRGRSQELGELLLLRRRHADIRSAAFDAAEENEAGDEERCHGEDRRTLAGAAGHP